MKIIINALLVAALLPMLTWGSYELVVVDVSLSENFILPFDDNGSVEIKPYAFLEYPSDFDADGNPSVEKEKIPVGLAFKIEQVNRDDGNIEFKYSLKYTENSWCKNIQLKKRLIQHQNIETWSGTGTLKLNEELPFTKRNEVRKKTSTGIEMFAAEKVLLLYTFKVVENNPNQRVDLTR